MENSGRDQETLAEHDLIKQVFVEQEQLYEKDEEASITEPFDPRDVDIVSKPMVISNIVEQLECDDIIIDPDFQRRPDLWDAVKQSRLIESLIINIPLPTFLFEELPPKIQRRIKSQDVRAGEHVRTMSNGFYESDGACEEFV